MLSDWTRRRGDVAALCLGHIMCPASLMSVAEPEQLMSPWQAQWRGGAGQ